MRIKLAIVILFHILLMGCSDMTDWQVYSDAGWEKNENEKYKEAINLYTIAFEKIHFGFFIDKEGLATLTTNMAATYRALGDYENAKKYYVESLNAWENLVGKEHENYAIIANNYSLFLNRQNQFDDALKYAIEALEIRSNIYGSNSEDVVISHRGISAIYLNMGRFDKAIEHAKHALVSATIAQGEGSELVASSELTLGRAYRSAGEKNGAVSHISNAIKIYESVAQKSTRAADTINELALIQQDTEQFSLANDSFHKALGMYIKIYDKNHPYIAIMYENIAHNYLDWGRHEKAFQAIQESAQISRAVYGSDHEYTKKVLNTCVTIAEISQDSSKECSG
jgi:tetratricopeptide (TPR) repeat protein